jgi:hypothetical protein
MGGFLLRAVSLLQRGGEDGSIVCYVRCELSSPAEFPTTSLTSTASPGAP